MAFLGHYKQTTNKDGHIVAYCIAPPPVTYSLDLLQAIQAWDDQHPEAFIAEEQEGEGEVQQEEGEEEGGDVEEHADDDDGGGHDWWAVNTIIFGNTSRKRKREAEEKDDDEDEEEDDVQMEIAEDDQA